MVFEHEPRDISGAQSPDWRLHQQDADDVEYVATPPQDEARAPQPVGTALPPPPPTGFGYPPQPPYAGGPSMPPVGHNPFAEPELKKRGSLGLKILSWVVLSLLTLLTAAVAVNLAMEYDQNYVRHEVMVSSTAESVGCALTVQTDAGETAVVDTMWDCVDAPKVGERITAYLPVDSDGAIIDGSDELTVGYLPGEEPANYVWGAVAIAVVGWLALGIASVRYLWVNRTR